MSLINDALKQARQNPPPHSSPPLAPLQPVADEPAAAWRFPGIILLTLTAVIGFGAWFWWPRPSLGTMVHPIVTTQPVVPVTPPVVARTVERPKAPAPPLPTPADPPPASPADRPVLQAIFYSPTKPIAIVGGKTVRPGEAVGQFKVKAISQTGVTLRGPGNQEIKLGMER